MITNPSAQLKLHSLFLQNGVLNSETSCKMEDFPTLAQSRPIGFGLFPAQRSRGSSTFVHNRLDNSTLKNQVDSHLCSRKRRMKRNHKAIINSGGPVDPIGYDDAYCKDNIDSALQSECNSTDSVCSQNTGFTDHASSKHTSLPSDRNGSLSTDAKIDDEGFLDGPIDSAFGVDTSCALISHSKSNQYPSASHLNQTDSRVIWIKHFASSDRTRQDSFSESGGFTFDSHDMPRRWNSMNPNPDSSSHAESSKVEAKQNPPLANSECSHPPTGTQCISTMSPEDKEASGDVDEDELEVTDLLHLIGSSLDRFNAILHPSDLSTTDSRATDSIGKTYPDHVTSTTTDLASSDYGSFEPTQCDNLNEASDDLQWFRPQLSTSCPDQPALRSLPRVPDFNLFTSECFTNLDTAPAHRMQSRPSDILTGPGKLINPSCFAAWPAGGSDDQSHRESSTSQPPFSPACTSSKPAGTSDVTQALTLLATSDENVAPGNVARAGGTTEPCMILGCSDPKNASYLIHSNKFTPFGGRTRQSLSCSHPTGDNLYSLDAILSGLDLLSLNRSSNSSAAGSGGGKRCSSTDPKALSTSQLEQPLGPGAPPGLETNQSFSWSREFNTYTAHPTELQSILRSPPLNGGGGVGGGRRSVLSACFASEHSTMEAPTLGAERTFSPHSDPVSSPHSNRGLFAPRSFPKSTAFSVPFSPSSPLPYPFTSAVPFISNEPPRMPHVLDAQSTVEAQSRGVYSGVSKQMYDQVNPTPRSENHPRQFIPHGFKSGTCTPLSASLGETTIQRHYSSGASSSSSNINRATHGLSPDIRTTRPFLAKSRRACSFYLRGHCKKEDCEFAHDLTKVTCKFWELGECFKGPNCPFLHGYAPDEATTTEPDTLYS